MDYDESTGAFVVYSLCTSNPKGSNGLLKPFSSNHPRVRFEWRLQKKHSSGIHYNGGIPQQDMHLFCPQAHGPIDIKPEHSASMANSYTNMSRAELLKTLEQVQDALKAKANEG